MSDKDDNNRGIGAGRSKPPNQKGKRKATRPGRHALSLEHIPSGDAVLQGEGQILWAYACPGDVAAAQAVGLVHGSPQACDGLLGASIRAALVPRSRGRCHRSSEPKSRLVGLRRHQARTRRGFRPDPDPSKPPSHPQMHQGQPWSRPHQASRDLHN